MKIMKKFKNTEIIGNDSIIESVKEGKIKKKKQKTSNKLKKVISKTDKEELVPKIDSVISANKKSKKKKKKNGDSKIEDDANNSNKKQQKVENQIEEQQDQTKSKKLKLKKIKSVQTPAQTSKDETVKLLTEADMKKIAMKKAKKLNREEKKGKQQEPNALETNVSNGSNEKKSIGVGKPKTTTDPDATTTKVLSKKEKNAAKRKLMKEQKLEEKKTRDPAVAEATIFIGNLPVNTKAVQLIRFLKDYGPINSIRIRTAGGKVIHKHKQRKKAGSLNAYVVLNSKDAAEKALSLNGTELKGHHVRVTKSVISPHAHAKAEAKNTVFVGNLKYTATEETLREIFTSCGEIEYVRCIRDGDIGCKGVAYVCFKTADAVGLALELNQTVLDDRPINVERYSVKKLGAKDARDAQTEKDSKSKKGAKQRIDGRKWNKNKAVNDKNSNNDADDIKKAKKNEFKGVKVNALKNKQKLKQKKSNNQMLKLAKKIAPKPKTE